VTGVFAPDCDCDAMKEIANKPIAVRRYPTDIEACRRYVAISTSQVGLGTEAIHGPSGHLLNVRD
jgi:hypothetical protein